MKKNNIIKYLLFVVSGSILSFVLTNLGYGSYRIYSSILTFIILSVFIYFNKNTFEKVKNNEKNVKCISVIYSIITSFFSVGLFFNWNYAIDGKIHSLLISGKIPNTLVMIGLLIGCFYFLYILFNIVFNYVVSWIKKFCKRMTLTEKRYFIISTVFFSLLVIIIYSFTSVFYLPKLNGNIQAFDVIYSSDTGAHGILQSYVMNNAVENDLRQPLFAIFSYCFMIVPYLLSKMIGVESCFYILSAIIQVFLLSVISVIFTRLMNLDDKKSIIFYLIYNLSYPYILFSLNMEQYIFGLFWLIMFIYSKYNDDECKFMFCASTGSLLTNGILFPFISKEKKIKKCIIDYCITGLYFIGLICIFGQLPLLIDIAKGTNHLSNYVATDLSSTKYYQFSHFITNCFIAPSKYIVVEIFDHPSFQLPIYSSFDYMGFVIFILCFIGFFRSDKSFFDKVCLFWMFFSIFIMIVLGYGTNENGLILYSLYFGWAYVCLLFRLIESIKNKYIFLIVSIICIVVLILLNSKGLYDLLKFALTYFDRIL